MKLKLQPPRASERQVVLQAWFDEARALHGHNKLPEAEVYYEAILKAQPAQLDAKHLLGLLRHQQGRHSEALKILRQVVGANPSLATVQVNLANVYRALGRFDDALAGYNAAIRLKPDYVEAFNNRGVLLLVDLARPADALADFNRALAANGGNVEALYNRGIALGHLHRPTEALASYDAALAAAPNDARILTNRGSILRDLKRPEEALESFDRAIAHAPGNAEAHLNRGNVLRDLKRHAEAIDSFDRALAVRPTYVEALTNRGIVLNRQQRWADALASVDAALALKPNHAEAHLARGQALRALDRQAEALQSLDLALAFSPDYAEALVQRGNALTDLGRRAEAIACFDRALSGDPDDAAAHFGRGLASLASGDLAAGWRGYAYRFRLEEPVVRHLTVNCPPWDGGDLAGKRVIVDEEQGNGDTLQFARYLPLLAAGGADVTFVVRSGLHRLLRPIARYARFVTAADVQADQPPVDLQSPLLSLPAAFGTTIDSIPADVPYLTAEPALIDSWRQRIGPDGYRIGIAWQGNPAGDIDRGRSIPLGAFAVLSAVPGVRLISLQRHHGLDQLIGLPSGMRVETFDDLDCGPDAFVDTAAVMASLDLIITSDTAIAHLAGALGRPVWLALKQAAEWRWLADRADSPWYPTMRLYRQGTRGDWAGVFAAIAADLASTQRADP